MKKISEQLFEVATMLMQTFNPNKIEEYQWKKYKSKQNDFRNVYFISDTMLEDYSDDKVFQNALKNGYLIFEDNKLIGVHSLETIDKLEPEKINKDDVLIIGKFNDCYPCPKNVFENKYKHVDGSRYMKLANIVIEAYQNNNDNIVVESNHGQQICKSGDYIIRSDNDYNVVDKVVFEETYKNI